MLHQMRLSVVVVALGTFPKNIQKQIGRGINFQRKRDDNKNKICAFQEGVGRGAERKIVQNAIFYGKRHDNKILKVKILLSRNFVVMSRAVQIRVGLELAELSGRVGSRKTPGGGGAERVGEWGVGVGTGSGGEGKLGGHFGYFYFFSVSGAGNPEGPARHLDASRQKLTPHCLAAIFDSQLPSLKLSLKMPPKLPLPHKRGHFLLFQNCPRGEGSCAATERQKLSRGNFCLAASRCLSRPSGK